MEINISTRQLTAWLAMCCIALVLAAFASNPTVAGVIADTMLERVCANGEF